MTWRLDTRDTGRVRDPNVNCPMAVVGCLMKLAKLPDDQMTGWFTFPIWFRRRFRDAMQDSGRVQYWVFWSLGQWNKFIAHPTTAIAQLTFAQRACPVSRVSNRQVIDRPYSQSIFFRWAKPRSSKWHPEHGAMADLSMNLNLVWCPM